MLKKKSSLCKPVILRWLACFLRRFLIFQKRSEFLGMIHRVMTSLGHYINRCWLVVSFPCLSKSRGCFASLGRCGLHWFSTALNAILHTVQLPLCLWTLGINAFIKPLSVLLKKTKSLQKIIYSTSHGHSSLIIRVILELSKEWNLHTSLSGKIVIYISSGVFIQKGICKMSSKWVINLLKWIL